jgi:hypothetical protein
MMLRESIDGIPDAERNVALSAAARTELLESFVDAVVGSDVGSADRARSAVVDALGHEWLVDASAVIANFEMMTRLADGTGARLRPAQMEAAEAIRSEFGLDEFASRRG